jgi:MoaA/NifB/PqqE/SkfB family radical SAM enzyme
MNKNFNAIELTTSAAYFSLPVVPSRVSDDEQMPFMAVPMPLKVYFDMTYRCNLTCRHCITASSPYSDTSQELPTPRIKVLVHELKTLGIQEIAVGGGEPFVHPDWADVFKHITNLGIKLIVTTNGILLNGRILDILKEVAPTEVRVSFDGGRYFHNSIRGRDSYDKAMKGLNNLIQNGFNAVARYTYCNGADAELENLFQDVAATGCKTIKIALLKKAGRATHEPDLLPQTGDNGLAYWLLGLGRKYKLTVQLSSDDFEIEFSETNDTKLRRQERKTCGAGFDTAYISPRGHVLSCVTIPNAPFGQLHYDSFAKVWQSQHAHTFRHRAAMYGTCRTCDKIK